MRIIGDMLKRGDANKLAAWWNLHRGTYFNQFRVERSRANARYWRVVRYD